MLSSVPTRLIARRSRSLSPCSRVLQTSANGGACHGVRETPAETNRNPIVSTSRVSRKGILSEENSGTSRNPSVQYHHLAPRWLSNLENRRSSWAALASRGRNNNQYWEESRDGGEGRGAGGGSHRAGVASAGVLSAAAVAFCLKKDADNKGRCNFVSRLGLIDLFIIDQILMKIFIYFYTYIFFIGLLHNVCVSGSFFALSGDALLEAARTNNPQDVAR